MNKIKAAQNSVLFKAPETKSPFPVSNQASCPGLTFFSGLTFRPGCKEPCSPVPAPNDLAPALGLRGPAPRAWARPPGGRRPGRPLPRGHPTFASPQLLGGCGRVPSPGRAGRALPAAGGHPPGNIHWPERAAAAMLMSGGRECGGRSGGGRPAARARVGGRRVGAAASMLLGCGSASHTRGGLVLTSSGGGSGGAASGARVCSGAGSERAARGRGSRPGRGPGTRHGTAEGRRRGAGAAALAGRRVPDPAERAGEAAGALSRHLQLYQGVHHLRGLLLGAQDRAGRHQLPVSEWDPLRPLASLRPPPPEALGPRDPDPSSQPLSWRLGGGAL